VLADALKATTLSGSITVAVKGTSTDTTSNDTNLSVKSGNNTSANLVLRAKDNKEAYDQWLTWDLAKTEKGTNTKLADGGYIVIPSNNLGTTNYNGQDRDSAFRWLNNSDSSTNDRRAYSETTQTTYNNPTIAFQSLAKYANDNTTTAADAAKKFVEELGKLRGINKVNGESTYRYIYDTTWYKGQEF
jgi:hypothetical protein